MPDKFRQLKAFLVKAKQKTPEKQRSTSNKTDPRNRVSHSFLYERIKDKMINDQWQLHNLFEDKAC